MDQQDLPKNGKLRMHLIRIQDNTGDTNIIAESAHKEPIIYWLEPKGTSILTKDVFPLIQEDKTSLNILQLSFSNIGQLNNPLKCKENLLETEQTCQTQYQYPTFIQKSM